MSRKSLNDWILPNVRKREAELIEQIKASPDTPGRGMLLDEKWHLLKIMGNLPMYASESGQDHFIDTTIFNTKKGGVFVDIGAFDGVHGSNTLFFEKFRGWTGLLVEAAPKHFAKCVEWRGQPCVQAAVSDQNGIDSFVEVTKGLEMMSGLISSFPKEVIEMFETGRMGETRVLPVETVRLDTLLKQHALHQIDYLSIDIEGGELAALRDFPFDEYDIRVISLEMNANQSKLRTLMAENGYKRAACIGVDEIYVRD